MFTVVVTEGDMTRDERRARDEVSKLKHVSLRVLKRPAIPADGERLLA